MRIILKWSEPEPLLPMGKALTEIEPNIILCEAKRQYEALVHMPYVQKNSSATSGVIRKHYRSLFDSATTILDGFEKLRLLTICFAYKTRACVLQFLQLLDNDAYPWASRFMSIVHDFARDTVFEDAQSHLEGARIGDEHIAKVGNNTLEGVPPGVIPSQTGPATSYGLRSSTAVARATPTKRNGPYFVITTLPFAFPEEFFTVFALHAPIANLTVPDVLSHPSVMQLALSTSVSEQLRSNPPDLWKPVTPSNVHMTLAQARHDAEEEDSWATFFDHLLQDREPLVYLDGYVVGIDEGDDGYGKPDLAMWLAEWRGERQSVGNKEKGQEQRLRMKLNLGNRGAVDEFVEDVDVAGGIELPSENKKRVSWNEKKLVTVREFAAED